MPKVSAEHRQARRDQIVAAARRCVVEQGFHKTTMADVIRESGLSAGAVYGYFRSKDEIVAAIADDALSSVDQLFGRILSGPRPIRLADVVQLAIDQVVVIAERPGGDVTRVAVQAWAEALHNPAVRAIAGGKYRQLRERFVAVAERAQADGTVDRTVPAEYVAQALFGLIPGFILQRLIVGDITAESYKAGVAAILA